MPCARLSFERRATFGQPTIIATVPFEAPASGIWQPQFSIDGQLWKNYGEPVGAGFPFSSIPE
jgi:hypothetical protein